MVPYTGSSSKASRWTSRLQERRGHGGGVSGAAFIRDWSKHAPAFTQYAQRAEYGSRGIGAVIGVARVVGGRPTTRNEPNFALVFLPARRSSTP